MLKAVVATVSLGVGVDVRVNNVVSFSLGSTPEDTIQEAGRCMRGSTAEVGTQKGLAFFFQKGPVAAIHCDPSSDCRQLISEPLPKCQTEVLLKFFDSNFALNAIPCYCCYSCIKRDAGNGCVKCVDFLETYLGTRRQRKPVSTLKHLGNGLKELFNGLGMTSI